MNLTDDFSKDIDASSLTNLNKAFTKYFYGVIVLLTTMLAAWMLGDLFSAGGFTTMEIALLVLFSSTFLRFAAAFWSVVIDVAVYKLASQ